MLYARPTFEMLFVQCEVRWIGKGFKTIFEINPWLLNLFIQIVSHLSHFIFSDCWRDAKNPSLVRPHGRFGDYQCDSSVDLVASVLQFMKSKMGDKVDFIIWTG